MQKILKIVSVVFACGVLLILGSAGWFLFYSGDLPDTAHLRDFAPASQKQMTDGCLTGNVAAIPFDRIGSNLRNAVASAELSPESDGTLRVLFSEWKGKPRQAGASLRISRTLFCNSHDQMLTRHLKELRAALQLDRHFSKQELFTMYLNRVYLGECGSGVEDAAQCLFHKSAVDLDPAEAALIAGMINSPGRYSPTRHPDRALARRNAVLDAMVAAGKLSPGGAAAGKATPLLD